MQNAVAKNRIKHSGIGRETARQLSTNNYLHRQSAEVDISNVASDSTAYAELRVGEYVYFFATIALVSKTEIVGETYQVGAQHIVRSAHIARYLKKIELQINGTVFRTHTVANLLTMNGYRGHAATDGALLMPFGGPDIFVNEAQEDAYALGTANINDLRINFELTDQFATGSMSISLNTEWVPASKNVAYLATQSKYTYQYTAAGEIEITDLPVHADIAYVLVEPDKPVASARVLVDNETLFEGTFFELTALLAANHGVNVDALPANALMFDFWRGREAIKAMRGLRDAGQRKRNANVRIRLELMEQNTEVRVWLGQCGTLASQQ